MLCAVGVSFPENAVFVPLDLRVFLCVVESGNGPAAVLFVLFDPAESASQFFCRDRGRSASEEWIEDHVARPGACEDQFGDEFFRLLGRVVRIFRHGPVGDRDVVPEIGRIRDAVVAQLAFLPVFRLPVLPIGSDDFSFHFYGFDVEVEFFRDRAEPDVLAAVLPVVLGTAPFFSLPGDPVSDFQVLFHHGKKVGRTFPIAAQIDRGVGFQKPEKFGEPAFEIFGISISGTSGELETMKILIQIVRRINDQQIYEFGRKFPDEVKKISVENAVLDPAEGKRSFRDQKQTFFAVFVFF